MNRELILRETPYRLKYEVQLIVQDANSLEWETYATFYEGDVSFEDVVEWTTEFIQENNFRIEDVRITKTSVTKILPINWRD